MKKLILTLTLALASVVVCNAQLYVGGNLSYYSKSSTTTLTTGTSSTETKNPGMSSFTFSPKVGYNINNKLSVGLSFSISPNKTTSYKYSSSVETKTDYDSTYWSVNPFVRYTFVEVGNLSIMGEASIGIFGANTKTKTGTKSTDGYTTSGYSINLAPVLSYKLSNKFSIESYANFLALGFVHKSLKYTDSYTYYTGKTVDTTEKIVDNSFNFGVNGTQNLFNLGVIYRF